MKDKISAIAKRASSADAAAFGELYAEYSSELYRYALYFLGSREAAQDAVQDAMLEAFRGVTSLRNSEAAKAWLFTILARTCKHSLREKYGAVSVSFEQCAEIPVYDVSDNTLHALEVARMLGTLPPDEKEVILLSVVGGYTSREIASLVGCTPGTVRSRLSRSLAKLRKGEE